MRQITRQELATILELHEKWLNDIEGGVRADLSGVDLDGANLESADLARADLSGIKEDFFKRLSLAKAEVVGLYDYLIRGKIDGSCYGGDCCCFCGTIANVRGEEYTNMSNGLSPDASSPTERWFLGISEGDTPLNNQISAITAEWMREFMRENGIVIHDYKLVSNLEHPEVFIPSS